MKIYNFGGRSFIPRPLLGRLYVERRAEKLNNNFYSFFLNPIGNRTRIYHFSCRLSILDRWSVKIALYNNLRLNVAHLFFKETNVIRFRWDSIKRSVKQESFNQWNFQNFVHNNSNSYVFW